MEIREGKMKAMRRKEGARGEAVEKKSRKSRAVKDLWPQ